MKKNDIIRHKFTFLIKSNFSYSCNHESDLFYECTFDRESMHIAISYDCHNEFLNLTIKKGTTTVLETSYAEVIVDTDMTSADFFASQLQSIYSMFRNSLSLKDQQINRLLELYLHRVRTICTIED